MKVTESADKELKALFAKSENSGKNMRVYINGFG